MHKSNISAFQFGKPGSINKNLGVSRCHPKRAICGEKLISFLHYKGMVSETVHQRYVAFKTLVHDLQKKVWVNRKM